MPKLGETFDKAAESSASNSSTTFDPGVYMCRVQAVRTEWEDAKGTRWTSAEKEYVKLILDIDEGPQQGRFSDDYWAGEDKDWGHTLYMSWKETALGMLKHTFASINEANNGFDAQAAFEADKWQMFIGRRIRVYWDAQEYEANNGEVRIRVRPSRAVTESDRIKPKVKRLNGALCDYDDWRAVMGGGDAPAATSTASAAPSAYKTDDVPF